MTIIDAVIRVLQTPITLGHVMLMAMFIMAVRYVIHTIRLY